MKRVVLHIGTHKTGSTSIQSFLARNYEHLIARGVLFPLGGRYDNSNHAPLAWELRAFAELGNAKLPEMADWQGIIAELNKSLAHTVIISSEEFCLLPDNAIHLLAQLVREQRMNLEIVVFLRNQLSVLLSYYIELLKQGETDIDFSSFISKSYFMMGNAFNLIQFDYKLLLKKWEAQEGVKITAFEYLPEGNSVVGLMSLLVLKSECFDVESIQVKLNRAPNALSFTALLYANKLMSLCQNLSPNRKRQIAYDVFQKAVRRYPEGPKLDLYDDDAIRVVKAYYHASNEWLARKYGIDFVNVINASKDGTKASSKIELPLSELE